jgi:hypothetical protein
MAHGPSQTAPPPPLLVLVVAWTPLLPVSLVVPVDFGAAPVEMNSLLKLAFIAAAFDRSIAASAE